MIEKNEESKSDDDCEPPVQVAEIETTSINLDNSLAHNNLPFSSKIEIDDDAIKSGNEKAKKDSLDDYLASYLDDDEDDDEISEEDESELDKKIASLSLEDDIDKKLAKFSNQFSDGRDNKKTDIL